MQILFLGAPGSGKGTQCKKLAERLKLQHLSSGDLLREAILLNSDAGNIAKGFMDKGQLVPDEVLIRMFRDKLKSKECASGFILDGYPRNLAQAAALDKLLTELDKKLNVVIDLRIADSLLSERIAGRRICSNKTCNAVFHIRFSPPKVENTCDFCTAPLIHRSDDKEELVKKRLEIYHAQTEPLIDYYDDKLLLKTVDAEGDPEKIFTDVLETIKKTGNLAIGNLNK